ncbi:MAG: hypothetical protein ACYTBJ_17275 [Planctomycetota bacterium]|jgi:RNase P subunit RPR2
MTCLHPTKSQHRRYDGQRTYITCRDCGATRVDRYVDVKGELRLCQPGLWSGPREIMEDPE